MTPQHCITCGAPIPRNVIGSKEAYGRRKFCNMECRRNYPRPVTWNTRNNAATSHTQGRIEDVEFLLEDDAPERIATRMGLRAATLARWLDRHDRRDLARPFYRAAQRERQAA